MRELIKRASDERRVGVACFGLVNASGGLLTLVVCVCVLVNASAVCLWRLMGVLVNASGFLVALVVCIQFAGITLYRVFAWVLVCCFSGM